MIRLLDQACALAAIAIGLLGERERKRFHARVASTSSRPAFTPSKSCPILSKHQIFRALNASLSGLASALRTERAFRLELSVLAAALPVSFVLTPDFFRRAELIACLLAVLAVELLNTSIEKLCDRTTPQIDPVIKIVKDMGSAAVFCALCMAGVIWIGAGLALFA